MAKEKRFTGVEVIEDFQGFQEFYQNKSCSIDVLGDKIFYPNQYLVLKSNGQNSQLAKISTDGKSIIKINEKLEYFSIKPKNKEQTFLFDMLSNETLKVITVTGKAGTGKSLLIGAYLLEMINEGKIDKLVISKPMEIVGNSKYFGTVPGDEKEKFSPFLLNFKYLFDKLSEEGGAYFEALVKKGMIEFIPLELMRGVSFGGNTAIYLDECQNIPNPVLLTLGTKVGDESRLILSGDVNQIDVKGADFYPGINKLIGNEMYRNSPITGHIHLLKIERGPVAQLFADIYESE